MKIGILADIHGNVIALKNCIDFLKKEGCSEFLFLGDYISDICYTTETLDYLYYIKEQYPCFILRGNREEYMLNQKHLIENDIKEGRWISNSASGNLLYTYNQLREEDIRFFDSLPITFAYEKEGYPSITCCHGSPDNARELLQLDGDNTERWLNRIDTDYLICGHTHRQGSVTHNGKLYCNPGSAGITIGDPGVGHCMLMEAVNDNGKTVWKPRFFRVSYNNIQVALDIKASGLLECAPWFVNSNIYTLLTGEDLSAELVVKSLSLAKETGRDHGWPQVEEACFEEVAGMLGIPDYRIKDIEEAEYGQE